MPLTDRFRAIALPGLFGRNSALLRYTVARTITKTRQRGCGGSRVLVIFCVGEVNPIFWLQEPIFGLLLTIGIASASTDTEILADTKPVTGSDAVFDSFLINHLHRGTFSNLRDLVSPDTKG